MKLTLDSLEPSPVENMPSLGMLLASSPILAGAEKVSDRTTYKGERKGHITVSLTRKYSSLDNFTSPFGPASTLSPLFTSILNYFSEGLPLKNL